jgi:hypothetical protein
MKKNPVGQKEAASSCFIAFRFMAGILSTFHKLSGNTALPPRLDAGRRAIVIQLVNNFLVMEHNQHISGACLVPTHTSIFCLLIISFFVYLRMVFPSSCLYSFSKHVLA